MNPRSIRASKNAMFRNELNAKICQLNTAYAKTKSLSNIGEAFLF